MNSILEFLSHFSGLAPEQWVGLISLAAIGLAYTCIRVLHSIVKGQSK